MEITGKTALVTGANRGLGRQRAAQLRDRGARVRQAGRTASGGSMESTQTAEWSPSRVSARALPWLSRRTGFWAIAFSFLAVAAFSTAPSSLYGLYEQQEHLSSLTITIVYAVYALGIMVSLLLAGHVSDWYRPACGAAASSRRRRCRGRYLPDLEISPALLSRVCSQAWLSAPP